MRANPSFCREKSARCAELAAAQTDPELKRTFADLAASWSRMAMQIEEIEAASDANADAG